MNCAGCTYFDRDYSDDGYLPTGKCSFRFPPQFSFDNSVREDDYCYLSEAREGEDP